MMCGVIVFGFAVEAVGSFSDSDRWYAIGFAVVGCSFAAIAAVALTGWRDLGSRSAGSWSRRLAWLQLVLAGCASILYLAWWALV
jgi:hypothetical protein